MRSKGDHNGSASCAKRTSRSSASVSGLPGLYEDGVYEVRAGAPVSAGKPVFLCYGDLSNEVLLARYGFVDRTHPTDSAVLHPSAGTARLLRIAAKRQCDRSHGLTRGVDPPEPCHQNSNRRLHRRKGKQSTQAADAEAAAASRCCVLPSPSFCWNSRCAPCSCRSATLAEAGLWPLANAGECSFFAPTQPKSGATGSNDVPVTWNLL